MRTKWFIVAGLSIAVASSAFAESAQAPKNAQAPKPIVIKNKETIKATVEAIDHTNRTLTLKGPEGHEVTLEVDASVTRFDQMKVGDVVTADYYEEVAIDIHKAGTATPADSVAVGGGKAPGAKPAGAIGVQHTMTVTIQAIDPAAPAVTVKTADGDVVSFRVRDKKNLKGVEVGDKVTITETAALAISVDASK